MNKTDLMKEYYFGNRALYLNFLGDIYNEKYLKQYITDKNSIISAKMSLLSLIMLSIKEDIVENVGNLNYESKIFLNALENTVSYISIQKDDGYCVDNYKFSTKEEIVSLIRNKLAHGRFIIDYDKNVVILNRENEQIEIDIDNLSYFIVRALQAYLRDIKTNEYIHDFCVCSKVLSNREKPIKTISEIKNLVRNIKHYVFKISSNENEVPQICINVLEDFIINYKNHINSSKFYELSENLKIFLESYNCKCEMSSKKIKNEKIEEQIINYASNLIKEQNDLNYEEQVNIIMQESLNYINPTYKKVSQLYSVLKVLNIIEAIKTYNTSDVDKLYNYFIENDIDNIYINYNEIGVVLINLFNSLFMYGFDEKYKISGGYKLDRQDNFDFGTLDFQNIYPSIDGIDYTPLMDAKTKYKSCEKEYNEVDKLIKGNKEHLSKIENNEEAIIKINNKINDLMIELKTLYINKEESKKNLISIAKDFKENKNYFKNFAIVNGIRNSIAHGNYEIISGESLEDSKIIFNDIYKGKLTFKLEVSFYQFSSMLEDNFETLFKYLDKCENNQKNIVKLNK